MTRDDRQFVGDDWLVPSMRRAYVSAFMEGMDKEPVSHKKVNAGRLEANTRLRRYRYAAQS